MAHIRSTTLLICLALGMDARQLPAQDPPAAVQRPAFQTFVQQQALSLRRDDLPPQTADDWQSIRRQLRDRLIRAWGGFPEQPCPLSPQVLGELRQEGFRVERVLFQTLPDVWMTANVWLPESAAAGGARLPAVLCVHGHWAGAKQDPVVQSRCLGLVKLGFVVLSVDALGAGERAVAEKLGEYHGEMTGAMLLPVGRPLSGLQVYENMRAVDYLQSRPEVDPERIGITGASGGGNQSMYAGAIDERFRCVVPTCSVGTYQAYLSAACCMCEVVPGALRFTEEGDVLGLAADRGLMVTSATRDAFQFSVDQARVSVERAQAIGRFPGGSEVRHTIIESPHHYNQPMREAMYGWMTKHLKVSGDGSPIAEPAISSLDPESLRCFPGDTRPDDFMTIPRLAAREARRLLQERTERQDRELLDMLQSATSEEHRNRIRSEAAAPLRAILGDFPEPAALQVLAHPAASGQGQRLEYDVEPGIRLEAWCDAAAPASDAPRRLVLILDPDSGAEQAFASPLAQQLRAAGWRVVAPELRATGRLAVPRDRIGHAPDHNSAEWSLWIGRPLLGQWVHDVRRTLDALAEHSRSDAATVLPTNVAVTGIGAGGVVALAAGALDSRISQVACLRILGTWVSDVPYRGQRLGIMVPGILPSVGDMAHLAALNAPRRVILSEAVTGGGETLSESETQLLWSFTSRVFAAHNASDQFEVVAMERLISSLR